jgi:hypothetical protein
MVSNTFSHLAIFVRALPETNHEDMEFASGFYALL